LTFGEAVGEAVDEVDVVLNRELEEVAVGELEEVAVGELEVAVGELKEVGVGELEEVGVGELEEVVEEDPNGSPMRLPLAAICCASVLLKRSLVQSLASC
jgi:hypothetical protein